MQCDGYWIDPDVIGLPASTQEIHGFQARFLKPRDWSEVKVKLKVRKWSHSEWLGSILVQCQLCGGAPQCVSKRHRLQRVQRFPMTVADGLPMARAPALPSRQEPFRRSCSLPGFFRSRILTADLNCGLQIPSPSRKYRIFDILEP